VPRLARTRLARGLAVGMGYRQALVVLCPPVSVLSTAPQVSCDAMGWCERYPVSLRPDPNSNPDANPHLAGAAECRHPTGREKVGSLTLQTHQDPILLLPCLWFEVLVDVQALPKP
jgi:hypothetical protein